jgi:formylmethanofuran:tetrahydromethanopterin formyltransferase
MKKWTKDETTALIASVAENGYSKGIRKFMDSTDNVNGRTFAACEYMIHRQSHNQKPIENLGDAVVSIADCTSVSDTAAKHEEKRLSVLTRILRWIFGVR